jgi:hypothetical protein
MFKTALRLLALMLIVAGSFYCGRATTSAKSESTPAVATSPALFQLSDVCRRVVLGNNVEFQFQKSLPIAAAAESSPLPNTPSAKKTRAPNHPDLFYYLEWDEDGNCHYYKGERIDTQRDSLLYNKWCRPGERPRSPFWRSEVPGTRDTHDEPEYEPKTGLWTYQGEELNKDREIKEVFHFAPFER